MDSDSHHADPRLDGMADTDSEVSLNEPAMYSVIIHNDHYTAMEFVVEVLMRVFQKAEVAATKIMLDVHRCGQGICGIYTYDIAVTKVSLVHAMAKRRGFPLKCSYEKV